MAAEEHASKNCYKEEFVERFVVEVQFIERTKMCYPKWQFATDRISSYLAGTRDSGLYQGCGAILLEVWKDVI